MITNSTGEYLRLHADIETEGAMFRRDRAVPVKIGGRPIAEFDSSDDAFAFCNMKGRDYTVTGGIHKPFAVCRLIEVTL